MATWYALRGGFKKTDEDEASDSKTSSDYELTKWDDHETRPLEKYTMSLPHDRFHYCNCPSPKRPCKHYEIALNLLSLARNNSVGLESVIWQDDKGLLTHDM